MPMPIPQWAWVDATGTTSRASAARAARRLSLIAGPPFDPSPPAVRSTRPGPAAKGGAVPIKEYRRLGKAGCNRPVRLPAGRQPEEVDVPVDVADREVAVVRGEGEPEQLPGQVPRQPPVARLAVPQDELAVVPRARQPLAVR